MDQHIDKRQLLQPSTSVPLAALPAGSYLGSETANNRIERKLFERLQSQPSSVRARIQQGYQAAAANPGLLSSASGSSGSAIFESSNALLNRLGQSKSAFARTQSLPAHRIGELQPLADVALVDDKLARELSGGKPWGAAPDSEAVVPVLPKRGRDASGGAQDDADAVFARWAEDEDDAGSSSPPSTQDSSNGSDDLEMQGQSEQGEGKRSISSLPKRAFTQTRSFAPRSTPFAATASTVHPFSGGAPSTIAASRGMAPPTARTFTRMAASEPVGSAQMRAYLQGLPADTTEDDQHAAWRKVDFGKFTSMDEGF